MRAVLLVGGAPRLIVDAVRHITVQATGTTAVALSDQLLRLGHRCDLLLSADAVACDTAARYTTRDELDTAIQAWLRAHGDGVVVMSAAVNDYQVAAVERITDGHSETMSAGAKIPSRADELVIHLKPARKLIDDLATWGHSGPLIGFKYEHSTSVIDSAKALRARTGAALVVANSLDGSVQALVSENVAHYDSRQDLLTALTQHIDTLIKS